MSTKIRLTYFKSSGKYYSGGTYNSEKDEFYEVISELKDMLREGKRPGLVDGFDFDVLAEVFHENGPLPHLIVRTVR